MLPDLDAEGLALLRVLHAGIATRLDEARRARSDGVAPLVEREHRNFEAFALAPHQVLGRHLHVFHLEEAGVPRQNAPLLLQRAAREPLERPLDDEGADPG